MVELVRVKGLIIGLLVGCWSAGLVAALRIPIQANLVNQAAGRMWVTRSALTRRITLLPGLEDLAGFVVEDRLPELLNLDV